MCKKPLTRHGGQKIKQVPKIDRIQEHPTSPKLIPWGNLQHNSIASHIVYVNFQRCNSSLSFDKFLLTILNCWKIINLISNYQLKSSQY